MNAPTDEKLLRDHLAGDDTGFELLVRRYSQDLFQFVWRFTRSQAAAEDAVQATFLQVHSSASQFDFKRSFKPWLFTIAANKARDYLRTRKRKREVPIEAYVDPDGDTGPSFVEFLSVESPLPHEPLSVEENRTRVRTIIQTMPERLCEILILAYYHRFPYKEIAEMLDIPLGTVKSRLHAAVTDFGRRYQATFEEKPNPPQPGA